jgi:tetratricopeptide (TPR) repeat protein
VLDPRNVDALIRQATLSGETGDYRLAIGSLDTALDIEKHNPVALYNRGVFYFNLGEYDHAIADYSRAIELDPTQGLAYNNRCLARAVAGKDLVDALADCDRALKLMPTNTDVRNTRGLVYLKLGDPAIAAAEYDLALAADPNDPIALFGRGLARIKDGETAKGEQDQAAARALMPGIERAFSVYGIQ